MFSFDGQCPHCFSDRGFVAFGVSAYTFEGEAAHPRPGPQPRPKDDTCFFSVAGNCLACGKPVVAQARARYPVYDALREAVGGLERDLRNGVEIEKIFPQPVPPYSHPSLPEKVSEAFIALQQMLREKKPAHFIITGCRTVLEAAVRDLGGQGATLHNRIENLFSQGIITKTLSEWAHNIRLTGNEAAHDMEGTAEEAAEMVAFTKLFLQFTFEMPAVIAVSRRQPT